MTTFAVIDPPVPGPPRSGLLASLSGTAYDKVGDTETVTGDPNPQRWTLGFSYLPYPCGSGGVLDPCEPGTKTIGDNPGLVSYMPFGVWEGMKCSAFGWSQVEYETRATNLLLARESYHIAHEFWGGALAKAAGFTDNMCLADLNADVLTSGPATIVHALGCLEGGLADYANGEQGAVHATVQLVAEWAAVGHLWRAPSGQLYTYNGNLVIGDSGYDGSGPNGAPATDGHQWAYATTVPTVRRSSITVVPASYAQASEEARTRAFAAATGRALNDIEFRAERLAAVTFDHQCAHVAVEVDVPKCLIGGVS